MHNAAIVSNNASINNSFSYSSVERWFYSADHKVLNSVGMVNLSNSLNQIKAFWAAANFSKFSGNIAKHKKYTYLLANSAFVLDNGAWEGYMSFSLLISLFCAFGVFREKLPESNKKVEAFLYSWFPPSDSVWQPYNMGTGILFSMVLASLCGVVGFYYTWFVLPQVVICLFAALSFMGPIPVYRILVNTEASSKWLFWGLLFVALLGPTAWGLVAFGMCGVFVWLFVCRQWLFVIRSWQVVQEPLVLVVSLPPLIFWGTSFFSNIASWGWFVEILVISVFFHQHFVKAWHKIVYFYVSRVGDLSKWFGYSAPSNLFRKLVGGFNKQVFSTRLAMLFFLVINWLAFDLSLSRSSLLFLGCLAVCFGFTHFYMVRLVLLPAWVANHIAGQSFFTVFGSFWVFTRRIYLRFGLLLFYLGLALLSVFYTFENIIVLSYIRQALFGFWGFDLLGILWLTAHGFHRDGDLKLGELHYAETYPDLWLRIPWDCAPRPHTWHSRVKVSIDLYFGTALEASALSTKTTSKVLRKSKTN